ncbi:hypothetical protein OSTOST_17610 [Ostertagia ostertagi]
MYLWLDVVHDGHRFSSVWSIEIQTKTMKFRDVQHQSKHRHCNSRHKCWNHGRPMLCHTVPQLVRHDYGVYLSSGSLDFVVHSYGLHERMDGRLASRPLCLLYLGWMGVLRHRNDWYDSMSSERQESSTRR